MTSPLVFITGASSGIGQALAARFHRGGYRLALVARRAAEVQAWAQSQGFASDTYAVYAADVRDIAAIVGVGRACIDSQGVPDVVIGAPSYREDDSNPLCTAAPGTSCQPTGESSLMRTETVPSCTTNIESPAAP